MKYGIVSRVDLPEALDLTLRIIQWMEQYTNITVEENTARHLPPGSASPSSPLTSMDIDTLITVGGDGTILRALQEIDATIFGVNKGRVGFLTETSGDDFETDIEPCLARLLEGDYTTEQRSKLHTAISGGEEFEAVNEAVIHTAQVAKLRDFSIHVGGSLAEIIRADGLIIATPTGSTCYAMSAGSPIIDPMVPAHVIVPIAPYRISTRPMVVPADATIRIRETRGRETLLVVDGQREVRLEENEVTFTRSSRTARFIRLHTNFYERVREKFLR